MIVSRRPAWAAGTVAETVAITVAGIVAETVATAAPSPRN